jgi:hypothetical protein
MLHDDLLIVLLDGECNQCRIGKAKESIAIGTIIEIAIITAIVIRSKITLQEIPIQIRIKIQKLRLIIIIEVTQIGKK